MANRLFPTLVRRGLITIVVLFALAIGATWIQKERRHADALPEAIAASNTDADVSVAHGEFLTLRPRHAAERMGVIVYPGAYTDIRGYVPTLKPVAAAGYRVVIVSMPFELAVLGIDRALDVQAANPDVRHWVIIGHSIGGAMAPVFASRHPDALDGVILWDAYPATAGFANYPKPVWHIHRAHADGTPSPAFEAQRGKFPRSSHWVAIPGGIHMYFGSFAAGGYQEDWAPTITRATQQAQVTRATIDALEKMVEREGLEPSTPAL